VTGNELEHLDVVDGEVVQTSTAVLVRDRPRDMRQVELHLVDSFDEAWEFMHWLEGMDRVAVDTETTGLVRGTDRVRMVQVGGCDAGWAIPWERWSGLFVDMINKFLGRSINRIDMHNAKFDTGMLAHMGVQVPRDRIDDTMVMSHILEPNLSSGLKQQARRFVDDAAASAQVSLDVAINGRGGWTWATVPLDYGPYWQYAALDTVLTARLREHHWPLMQPYLKAYDLEMAYTWLSERMENHGMRVDQPYARARKVIFDEFVERAAAWVQQHYGVSAGSNQAIIAILQQAGYSFSKLTESGALALDKEVLGGIDHPLATTVLQRRQLQKMSSTYLQHFIEDADADGYIHPDIRTLGARTSRSSISRPSLQNLPTKSEANRAAESVRDCVIASEGNRLMFCDFDQIEMRLLAHLSGDRGLRQAFLDPGDFFVNLGVQIFDDPGFQKKDPRRRLVKNGTYAKVYGAGIAKMARTLGVPEGVMRFVMGALDTRYPGINSFSRAVESKAWERQKTEGTPYALSSLTGRRHVADHNKVYALLNYLIQGTAAEALKMKALELDAAGLGDYLVIPVHDEVVLDVPAAEVDDAAETLRRTMNDDQMFSVPISASVAVGDRWGKKEDM
jgi:DNA polymerase I